MNMNIQKLELERQILLYQNKIDQLYDSNRNANNNICECYKIYDQISKKIRQTEDTYNSRLNSILSKISNIPNGSKFGTNYYEKLKEILFGKNTNDALNALKNTQSSIVKKIDSYEDSINNNNSKITFYKSKIKELKLKISNLEVGE